ASRVLFGRRLLVLELDVEALREPFDRARKVELLGLANEGDQVALRTATEAVVELVGRIDGEARRPFVVEGTASDVARSRFAQRRPRGDDGDDVARGLDP